MHVAVIPLCGFGDLTELGFFFPFFFFFSFRYSVMYSPATFVLRWWFVSDLLTEICACLSLEYFERWQVRKRERVGKGISVPCTPYPYTGRTSASPDVPWASSCRTFVRVQRVRCVIACLIYIYIYKF